jgi:glutathione peroxidase
MNFYDIKVKDIDQNDVSLSEYKGKALLIVNTATGCGFTPQYDGLEALHKTYKDQGFEVLDFPCNQFLGQAPGSDEEIVTFCQLNFGTTFKTFSKIDVNGKNADSLFEFLKTHAPNEAENEGANAFKKVLKDLSQRVTGHNIKWNFTKFLVNQEGKVVARFAPTFKPEEIEPYIEKILKDGPIMSLNPLEPVNV